MGEDVRSGDAVVVERPDVAAPASTTTTVPPDPVEVRALAVGGCADDVAIAGEAPDDTEMPTTVEAVAAGGPLVPRSCEGEHRYELFATAALAAPEAAWPGPEQVGEDALRACTDAFETFVAVAWSESTLDHVALVPDEAGWAAGDRTAWCILFDLGLEPLEGSAAGSGW